MFLIQDPIISIKQFLNEAEYDVKNYADREG